MLQHEIEQLTEQNKELMDHLAQERKTASNDLLRRGRIASSATRSSWNYWNSKALANDDRGNEATTVDITSFYASWICDLQFYP